MPFRPSKQLGQNFLVNKGIVEKIIAAAELTKNDTVLEVGPGKGVLTEELVKYAGHVIAVEKDKRLYEMLLEKFKNAPNLILVNADILRFKLYSFKAVKLYSYKLVANIPYNISGAIFRKFLLADQRPQMIVVMVQKEVGERLLGKNKSILSLASALYGRAEKICDVSPGSFSPPPKVESAVIKMVEGSSPRRGEVRRDLIINPPCPSFSEGGNYNVHNPPHPSLSEGGRRGISREREEKILHLAKIGFSARRKKLISNLSTGLKIPKEKLLAVFGEIGLGANVRAEELNKDDWLKLAKNI